jgi:hypothetical protein
MSISIAKDAATFINLIKPPGILMGMMLLRIKSFFQIFNSRHYPISFTLTSINFNRSQEDNDQAFPVAL